MVITPVLIVSKQTLPNVLFLKEMQERGVELEHCILITTQLMEKEGRGDWILKAAKIDSKSVKVTGIVVAAEDYKQAKIDVQKQTHNPEAYYYVNLTGGTKMMSLAVYDYYKNFADCRCFYMPIGGKFMQRIFPDHEKVSLLTKLNLQEYLTAYGYRYESNNTMLRPEELANETFDKVSHAASPLDVTTLNDAFNNKIKGPVHKYWMGAWFEEWVYYQIKNHFDLSDDCIAQNCNLKLLNSNSATESDSEIDVLFVFNNRLFIIECKCYIANTFRGDKIYAPMYKLGAIQKTLGLHASCFLMMANHLGEDQQRMSRIELLKPLLNVREVFSLKELSNLETKVFPKIK